VVRWGGEASGNEGDATTEFKEPRRGTLLSVGVHPSHGIITEIVRHSTQRSHRIRDSLTVRNFDPSAQNRLMHRLNLTPEDAHQITKPPCDSVDGRPVIHKEDRQGSRFMINELCCQELSLQPNVLHCEEDRRAG